MAGAMQTLAQRAVSSGLYFPLEDIFSMKLKSLQLDAPSSLLNFIAGTCAGALNGFFLNPAARVKYHYWGKVDCSQASFFPTAREMYRVGGIRPFFAGSIATMTRDLLFGGTYAVLRHLSYNRSTLANPSSQGNPIPTSRLNELYINLFAASAATIVSSPHNYVRNIHYSSDPNVHAGSASFILRELLKDMMQHAYPLKSRSDLLIYRARFLQERLRLGWGTLRVGCGMAFGWQVYSICSKTLD